MVLPYLLWVALNYSEVRSGCGIFDVDNVSVCHRAPLASARHRAEVADGGLKPPRLKLSFHFLQWIAALHNAGGDVGRPFERIDFGNEAVSENEVIMH